MSREKQTELLINASKSNNFEVISNKQIEEMARKNCHIKYHMKNYKTCKECYETNYCACRVYEVCRNLYNAGYRKQSEGEWIDQHNGKYSNPIYVCSQCRKGTLLRPHINELDNMEMVQALSPFCPNCGARMLGGKADE